MVRAFLLLAWMCSCIVLSHGSAEDCHYTAEDGTHFDLSALRDSPSDFTKIIHGPADFKFTYHFAVCKNAQKRCQGIETSAAEFKSTFQGEGCRVLGSLGQQTWKLIDSSNASRGVQLTYAGGDECEKCKSRSVTINIECDEQAAGVGEFRSVEGNGTCHYTYTFASRYGCPVTSSPAQGGPAYRDVSPKGIIQQSHGSAEDCHYTADDGTHFDLSALRDSPSDFTKVIDAGGDFNFTYDFAVCKNAQKRCQNIDSPAAEFLSTPIGNGCRVLGSLGQQTWKLIDSSNATRGVLLTYTGGDPCDQDNSRGVTIMIECDEQAPGVGEFRSAEGNGTCHYTYTFASRHGCPVTSSPQEEVTY